MIIEFNNKLVLNYINGEDIDNIDDLENDCNFMMKIINITKDKNMYNLCSDNLKNNYEFVKFIVNTFKEEKSFINTIVLEYLKKLDSSDVRYKELCFIMSDIFNKRDDDRAIYYNLLRTSIYNSERIAINVVIDDEYDEIIRKQMGLGFALVLYSDLGRSEVITKYFANKFLEEIFYEKDNLTLEDFMHSKFYSLSILQKIGVKNFIIDYVKNYDVNLSGYLFAHIDLINDIEKDINKIISNWDNYLANNLERKIDIFEQEVDNIIDNFDVNFDFYDVCAYLDRLKINIPIKFGDYYDMSIINFIDINKVSLIEYKCLQSIVKLAKDLFLSPVIDKHYDFSECDNSINKKSSRILKFKSKNN